VHLYKLASIKIHTDQFVEIKLNKKNVLKIEHVLKIVRCTDQVLLVVFEILELGFFGGNTFFVGFPNGSCPFSCPSKFCHLEILSGQKNGERVRGLEFRRKTETTLLVFHRENKMRNRILETEKYLFFPVYWCYVLSLPPGRGGRLGDKVSSQTQAIQSIADKLPAHDCQDMLLTSQTQAIQSIADKLPAHDWSRYVTNQSDTTYTEYC
jgi:hypothetical protein